MERFRLIFSAEPKYGAMGGSWIGVCPSANGPHNELVLTHDCSPAELERQIAELKAELDAVLRASKARSAAFVSAKVAQREES